MVQLIPGFFQNDNASNYRSLNMKIISLQSAYLNYVKKSLAKKWKKWNEWKNDR